MGKRRREQLNADAQKLQTQRLGELADKAPAGALLLSDLPAKYKAAFSDELRTEGKLSKYVEGLDGFEVAEGDKAGVKLVKRKHEAAPPPKKQRPQKPCLAMLHSGRCRRGDECAYAHDVDNVPTCRFFREPGGCRRGRGCKHAHRADPLAPARDAPGSLLARLLRHDVAAEVGLALQCLTALLDATE